MFKTINCQLNQILPLLPDSYQTEDTLYCGPVKICKQSKRKLSLFQLPEKETLKPHRKASLVNLLR